MAQGQKANGRGLLGSDTAMASSINFRQKLQSSLSQSLQTANSTVSSFSDGAAR